MSNELLAALGAVVHWGVGGALVVALLFFLARFLLPGFRLRRQLRHAESTLKALRAEGAVLDLDRVRSEAMVGDALRHCWDEFRDTLHGQKAVTPNGTLEVTRWRATTTANTFFSGQVLVDAPLRAEFYKHLPGILTGLGIIGTFSGLILGLQAFGRMDLGDAEQARGGLRSLLEAVGGAFVVSASAITLAMLLTTIEKFVINRRYMELEALCGVIDSLFDAGAGEEYLQRLVEAAETSATQAMQMKESLVTDLRQVLTELTSQQIAAMTTTSSQLGQSITASLSEGLKEPLERISDAVQSVSGNQGDAVNKLLTDVLSSFTGQMESMFGGQMRGMGDMLAQTAATIEQASQRFGELIGQMQQAGSGATDAMARRMDEALVQMRERQNEANDQMRAFVEQMKQSVAQGQSESAALTMSMMKELGESTRALVDGLQEQARHSQQDQSKAQQEAAEQMRAVVEQLKEGMAQGQRESADATVKLLGQLAGATEASVRTLQQQADAAHREHGERQTALAADMGELLSRQGEQVSRVADALQRTEGAMRETIERIKASTDSHLDRMTAGADRLLGASDRLGDNLGLMKANADGLNGSAERLQAASAVLSTALATTQQALGDQKAVRDTLALMVADLRATVDAAKREAGVTAGLVSGLQQASQRLSEAQEASVANLEEATEAIGQAHGAFAKQVEVTLREGNRVFHQELAQATGLLKGAIQELGDVLENIPVSA